MLEPRRTPRTPRRAAQTTRMSLLDLRTPSGTGDRTASRLFRHGHGALPAHGESSIDGLAPSQVRLEALSCGRPCILTPAEWAAQEVFRRARSPHTPAHRSADRSSGFSSVARSAETRLTVVRVHPCPACCAAHFYCSYCNRRREALFPRADPNGGVFPPPSPRVISGTVQNRPLPSS